MLTNQQVRKALTIVIDLAKANTIPEIITDEQTVAIRNKQLEAIRVVEHIQTILFMNELITKRDK